MQWNGSMLATSFINANQLTVTVPASLITSATTVSITVISQGVVSNPTAFNVTSGPTITSLTPALTTVGGPDFTLTVNGSGFSSSADVEWNGMMLSTMFVSSEMLTAQVGADLIGLPGPASITVKSKGATSNPVTFTIVSGLTITSVSLAVVAAGGSDFALIVDGAGFDSAATVQWNGIALATMFVNESQLEATVPADLIADPGTASVTVSSGDSTSAPVTITIIPSQMDIGNIDANAIVSAANFRIAAISPGELLTIFGHNFVPSRASGISAISHGKISTALNGFTVFFDDVPAPLIYVSPNQLNIVAPYSIAGNQKTSIHFELNGQRSNYVSVPVSQISPGIFTINSSGTGPAAILNQNGTVNSVTNPAPRGSTISIFATGYGPTWPESIDGIIGNIALQNSAFPIAAYIGDAVARVSYAGVAPTLVTGVLQVNVTIPNNAQIGGDVPISLTIDYVQSQTGVTVSIK